MRIPVGELKVVGVRPNVDWHWRCLLCGREFRIEDEGVIEKAARLEEIIRWGEFDHLVSALARRAEQELVRVVMDELEGGLWGLFEHLGRDHGVEDLEVSEGGFVLVSREHTALGDDKTPRGG